MNKAIVTGATGFIGSWLTQELLNNSYEVTVVARNPNRLLEDIRNNGNVRIIESDLANLCSKSFNEDTYDVFFHLAWGGVSPEQKNDVQCQIANIPTSINVLSVCKELDCKRFVATGTVAEYALTSNVMDLNSKQNPNDMYGAAKVSAHYFLEVYARKIGQSFNWVVLPSTYGEGRTDNNIITYTIKTLLNGDVPEYGNLDQMWDFLYVSDVVRALRLIGENGKSEKTYGIGSGLYRPLREYIEDIRDEIDPKLGLKIGTKKNLSGSTFSSCVNIYDLIKDTGFQPKTSFLDGIKKTINYWRKGE